MHCHVIKIEVDSPLHIRGFAGSIGARAFYNVHASWLERSL